MISTVGLVLIASLIEASTEHFELRCPDFESFRSLRQLQRDHPWLRLHTRLRPGRMVLKVLNDVAMRPGTCVHFLKNVTAEGLTAELDRVAERARLELGELGHRLTELEAGGGPDYDGLASACLELGDACEWPAPLNSLKEEIRAAQRVISDRLSSGCLPVSTGGCQNGIHHKNNEIRVYLPQNDGGGGGRRGTSGICGRNFDFTLPGEEFEKDGGGGLWRALVTMRFDRWVNRYEVLFSESCQRGDDPAALIHFKAYKEKLRRIEETPSPPPPPPEFFPKEWIPPTLFSVFVLVPLGIVALFIYYEKPPKEHHDAQSPPPKPATIPPLHIKSS